MRRRINRIIVNSRARRCISSSTERENISSVIPAYVIPYNDTAIVPILRWVAPIQTVAIIMAVAVLEYDILTIKIGIIETTITFNPLILVSFVILKYGAARRGGEHGIARVAFRSVVKYIIFDNTRLVKPSGDQPVSVDVGNHIVSDSKVSGSKIVYIASGASLCVADAHDSRASDVLNRTPLDTYIVEPSCCTERFDHDSTSPLRSLSLIHI